MAHEMVHLMASSGASGSLNQDGDNSSSDEIEMDGVFEFNNKSGQKTKKKQRQRNDREKLLAPGSRDRDVDGGSLSSLEDNDRPTFESTHLAFDTSTSTTTLENKYMRENSEPVIIEATSDQHGIRNPSFSEEIHIGSEGSVNQQRSATDGAASGHRKHSKISRTSSAGSRSLGSSNNIEEDIELKELNSKTIDDSHIRHFSSSSSDNQERAGLLESTTLIGDEQTNGIGKFCNFIHLKFCRICHVWEESKVFSKSTLFISFGGRVLLN